MTMFDRLLNRDNKQPLLPRSAVQPMERLLLPQLLRLDFSAGELPTSGSTASPWSRGYVLGMGCGVVRRGSFVRFDDRFCFDRAHGAFALAYGRSAARRLLAKTVEEALNGNEQVVAGLTISAADVARLCDHQPAEEPDVFWTMNQR